MEEKYINKILNFSDDIIGKGEKLIINKEQAKGIIKELKQDYVPKATIKLEIEDWYKGNYVYGSEKFMENLKELLGE